MEESMIKKARQSALLKPLKRNPNIIKEIYINHNEGFGYIYIKNNL